MSVERAMPTLRLPQFLRLGGSDPAAGSLFEFRRVGPVPAAAQVVAVVLLFVTTVLCTHAEYRAHETVFGFPGPGFNVLFAPIYEELVFRGWILGQLARRRSSAFAIAISSLLFGILHLRNIYWLVPERLVGQMVYTGAVFGPVAAWMTLKCRSLWPAVVVHYLNNLWYYV